MKLKLNKKEKISVLVIGLPLNLKNKLFDIEENIKEFIQKIKTYLPEIEIERIDERFTSKIARNFLNTYSDKQKIRRKKENLDKTIFFEDTVKNLIPAKELGITTVWMKNSINEKDFMKNCNFIDYSFNNLNEFLDTIKMRG